MSFGVLMTLTVIEIILLVGVLAIFLRIVTRQLRSIAATLAKVAFGVRAVEEQVTISTEVRQLNQLVSEVAERNLPEVTRKAQQAAAGR